MRSVDFHSSINALDASKNKDMRNILSRLPIRWYKAMVIEAGDKIIHLPLSSVPNSRHLLLRDTGVPIPTISRRPVTIYTICYKNRPNTSRLVFIQRKINAVNPVIYE